MGLRAALGARPSDLARAPLGFTLSPAFVGRATGTTVAAVGWKSAETLVYGVPPLYAAATAKIVTGVFSVVIAAVLPGVVTRAGPGVREPIRLLLFKVFL